MTPDWKYAPEWANHLAMDGNGKWYWYESPPVFDPIRDMWVEAEDGGRVERAPTSEAFYSVEARPNE